MRGLFAVSVVVGLMVTTTFSAQTADPSLASAAPTSTPAPAASTTGRAPATVLTGDRPSSGTASATTGAAQILRGRGNQTGRPSSSNISAAASSSQRPQVTNWQLQNPSGASNYSPTDPHVTGFLAPNTYFGPQFRPWEGMSGPLYEANLPPNQTAVPPVTRSDVYLAPDTYWNPANNRWNQMSPGGATPDPLGGWTTRIGW